MTHTNGKSINNMVNITHKNKTLRTAVATAQVQVSLMETISAIKNRTVPKGDVFEFSRAAGLLAVKKTSDVIPDCHPLPVEFTSITYAIDNLCIHVSVEVHTIYKTGVEVEAMHGAAITALTMYDMLKPIDPNVTISSIALKNKTGGKSDANFSNAPTLKCAMIVCSDSISRKEKEDKAGITVIEKLKKFHLHFDIYEIIPDDVSMIQEQALSAVKNGIQLLIFCGGTGLSKKDVTPDALQHLFTRTVPGLMEYARSYGQERMPYAMLSRGIAGMIDDTLVITLPGSQRGAVETTDALFPAALHIFNMLKDEKH